jgi:beta-lysine N6-acetyltransferase
MHPETPDTLLEIGKSLIQYGPYNQRVYILHADVHDLDRLFQVINEKVTFFRLSKVIGKIPESCENRFLKEGYHIEARIPSYYFDGSACIFPARYFYDQDRAIEQKADLIKEILKTAHSKKNNECETQLNELFNFRLMKKEDCPAMAKLYQEIFPSYPFPIYDPAYLEQTMLESVEYFGIFQHNSLIALSSIEKNPHSSSAEMTDFATLPSHRGKGLAGFLLSSMEAYLTEKYTFSTIYTIARSLSYGINTVFAKANYYYGGTLTNNTNIHGQIESMNIWHKKL